MPNDEHNTTDPGHTPHEDFSPGVQLSANTRERLEKLAPWRIDSALLIFPKRDRNFEGGYAIVSKGLLEKEKQKNNEGVEDETQESDDETFGWWWKPVAVKKMKLKRKDDTVRVLGLTIREAEFLVKLSHENVIKLEGFVEDVSKGLIWLVFPWEANGTLKKFVASYDWEIPERISLINDVAGGVAYLHGRNPPICHGDLKSINVLVNSKCRAIITDFGSARHPVVNGPNPERERTNEESEPAPSLEATLDPSTNTITLTCSHYTIRWAAPELLEEDGVSLACDIWAFGWVAYEVITSSIPFQDVKGVFNVITRIVTGNLPSISSDARMVLIQALCSLVGHCWSVDPGKRPTAEDCRKALRWIPKIIPRPRRPADAENQTRDSARLLIQLGRMYRRQSDYSSAEKYFARAFSVYSDLAEIRGKAMALFEVAETQRFQQQYSQAETSYSEVLNILADLADNRGRAGALWGLAEMHRKRDEYDQAVKLYSECLQIHTNTDDKGGRASALYGLAEVHLMRDEYDQAVKLYSECLQIHTNVGAREGSSLALCGLASVHRHRKEYSHAMKLLSDALILAIEVGDKNGKAFILKDMARVHHDQHHYKNAIHHYEQAAVVYKQIGHSNEAIVLEKAAELRRLIEDRTA